MKYCIALLPTTRVVVPAAVAVVVYPSRVFTAERFPLASREARVEAVAAEATPVPVGKPLITGVVRVLFVRVSEEEIVSIATPPTVGMFVDSRSVVHTFVTRVPVTPIEPDIVIEFVPRAKFPPDTVKPPVAVATVMFAVPSKLTPPIVRAFARAVAVAAFPVTEPPICICDLKISEPPLCESCTGSSERSSHCEVIYS